LDVKAAARGCDRRAEQIIHVRAPKTKHIEGKDIRTLPIFPEIRPYLDAAWEAAGEYDELVFQG